LERSKTKCSEAHSDEILAYMSLMLEKCSHKQISVKRQDFVDFGRGMELFAGVVDWFNRVNLYAKDEGV
jgi:hypothetical protein